LRRSSTSQGAGAAVARFSQLCTCAPADRGTGPEASPALDVPPIPVGGVRRAAVLRTELLAVFPPRGGTGGHDIERREAGRNAGGAANWVRAGDQSQDRQGARDHDLAVDPCSRRPGDRMNKQRFLLLALG